MARLVEMAGGIEALQNGFQGGTIADGVNRREVNLASPEWAKRFSYEVKKS